jgi:uncharacterized protein
MTLEDRQAYLLSVLDRHPALAIAVSGGVDSMVLAYVAHRLSRTAVIVVHAVSPAVPTAATSRVDDYARRYGWALRHVDAGEMADPAYLANPVNRCFYCKTNLYSCIGAETGLPIASGTNVDDLDDFRPGLDAARRHGVLHPFVEAGFRKRDIYALAEEHGLFDLAALPAQPCLASRIETGIGVDEAALRFIEAVENKVAGLAPTSVVRCRLTAAGVYVECEPLPKVDDGARIGHRVGELCAQAGRVFAGLRSYRRGSAFLRPHTASTAPRSKSSSPAIGLNASKGS